MRKVLFVLLLAVISLSAFAQDKIVTTNGDEIPCKVTKITAKNIKYRIFGSADSSILSMSKKSIFSITYESGVKEVFNETHVDDNDPEGHWDKRSMASQGKADAKQNYRGYKGARAGTVITATLTSPLAGLIPAIVCSCVKPKDKNLNYPDETLMQNKEYANAYRKQAHTMKSGKVWGGWGLGVGLNAAIIVIAVVIIIVL